MQRERKLTALRRALRDEGSVRGAEASFFCLNPRGCDGKHHKRKLAVNVETDAFHCWVCGYGGRSLAPLLRLLGQDDRDYREYVGEREAHGKAAVGKRKEYEPVRLPSEFKSLSVPSRSPYYSQAMAYLSRRGITSEDILTYRLGYCEAGQYAERVVLPSFDELGELNFFVGRAIWERTGLPYLSGKFDKNIIFNDLLVDWSKPITIVEGPFDALKAGTNAIPLQGKIPSAALLEKIDKMRPVVYVALDADAVSAALSLAEKISGMGIDTRMIDWPSGVKDPGEMSREDFDALRNVAARIAGPADILKFRVFHSATLERQ